MRSMNDVLAMVTVFAILLAWPSLAQAQSGSVTVYPVQSGLVDDASCCNPYNYYNSSASTFVLTGCFDSYYGCGHERERAAWRWDLEGQVPEGAEITGATIRWNQPYSCYASYVDVWIDANTQVLNSSYCSQMRSSSDQSYLNQTYSGSAVSWAVSPEVIEEALSGGYLCMLTENGTSSGCAIYNSGTLSTRVTINYEFAEMTGACCLALGQCVDAMTEASCQSAGGSWNGEDSTCATVACEKLAYVDIHHSIVGSSLLSTGEPCWTFDVYAAVSEGSRIEAIAGNSVQPKMIASTHGFYQDAYGGPTSKEINPAFYPFAADLHLDSRVTIGALDMTGDPFDENNLGVVGIDWEVFESGGDLSVGNGTWYVLADQEQGVAQPFVSQDCSEQHGVRIARLTAMGLDSTVMVEALVQGRDEYGEPWQDLVDHTFAYEPSADCNENGIPDACDIANGPSQDQDGNGVPDECESTCEGDADGDGDADVDDALAVIGGWGQTGESDADLNGDLVVDVEDLLQMLKWYGGC
ncbi:MAG: hypothetical protein MK116_04450 [Phycisphaerales bacterium]|nr:hypothetical protein [Phycisphaerales bacterium]